MTRDYAVVTAHKNEVDEVIAGFEADWQRKVFDPGHDAHLIWCRGNGRERIARLIDEAKHTLFVPKRAVSGFRHYRASRSLPRCAE